MNKEKLGKGFTIFPNRMLIDDRLTASDRSVAIVLYRFANNNTGEAYPARATICELAKVSNNTLTKSLDKLVDYGYFTRKAQFKKDDLGNPTKQQLPNIYTAVNPRGSYFGGGHKDDFGGGTPSNIATENRLYTEID